MGYGAYNTNPNAGVASLEVNAGVVPSGDQSTFTETLLAGNNVQPSIANERSNKYPTSRTLFNIYLTNNVRASTAGFLNWLCDTNPVAGGGGGQIQKGTDHVDGGTSTPTSPTPSPVTTVSPVSPMPRRSSQPPQRR